MGAEEYLLFLYISHDKMLLEDDKDLQSLDPGNSSEVYCPTHFDRMGSLHQQIYIKGLYYMERVN
jgi:hypothetical protein